MLNSNGEILEKEEDKAEKQALRSSLGEVLPDSVAHLCSEERVEARLKSALRVKAWMWADWLVRSEVQGRSEKGWQSRKTISPEIDCFRECVLFLGLQKRYHF